MTINQTTHAVAHSADGTPIAYEAYGAGPVVVVVGGAFNDRTAGRELAQALVTHGFTGVAYDRRGRGDSGDTKPYAVQREVEDLTAVIEATAPDEAAGQHAHAHGVSSGGALVLEALAAGAPVATASVLEPPYKVEGAPPWPERYIETLEELEAKGDREGILRYFHTRAVGLPEEMLDGMRDTPMWEGLLALTYTVRYDGLCMGPSPVMPDELLARIEAPVLAVSSTGTTLPFLPAAARAVAEGLPRGEYQQLEGGFHEVPATTLAPAIADFIGRAAG
ncbi:alpha/beta fold hydrolase [Intrasporangium sp.]|uniref:alpha/beta fold hydrolase n=1 Tax=Intrasporangium sp. TaxID=1925024 RepID=UPI0033653D1B